MGVLFPVNINNWHIKEYILMYSWYMYVPQERIFVYNCSNTEIYSLFDISAIVFNDCTSEIQQKHHLVGSNRQLVLIKALFYNGCTMN